MGEGGVVPIPGEEDLPERRPTPRTPHPRQTQGAGREAAQQQPRGVRDQRPAGARRRRPANQQQSDKPAGERRREHERA